MKAEDEFENAIDSFVRLGANDQCGKVFEEGLYGLPVRLKRKVNEGKRISKSLGLKSVGRKGYSFDF